MRLKSFQEFYQHLFLCPFAFDYIWVFVGPIRVPDVIHIQIARTVLVNLAESLLHKLQSFVIKLAADGHQELVDVQRTVPISIESREQSWNILL